ncbi:unnamed protein product, partial [Ceratitis capitata]
FLTYSRNFYPPIPVTFTNLDWVQASRECLRWQLEPFIFCMCHIHMSLTWL